MVTDFDLVAIPWTHEAVDAQTLMEALGRHVHACMTQVDGNGVPLSIPELKPHGRLAWIIPIDHGASIDLSVMPRQVV